MRNLMFNFQIFLTEKQIIFINQINFERFELI